MCRCVKPSLCKGRGTAAGGGRVAVNKIDNPSDGIRRQLPLHRGAKATGRQRPLHKGAYNALSKTALMRKPPLCKGRWQTLCV